ncbi:MAG: hypothetical protein Q4B73_06095 [Lachnospiraceae bacterium]|nr:hypothetical protein [Lachnospiraceae bacterium]
MNTNIKNQFIKPQMGRRVFLVMFGQVIMGFAVAILRIPVLGTDPFSAMMLGLTNHTPFSYGVFCSIANVALFVFEILWGRKYIGIGTFANWFILGFFVDFACFVFRTLGIDGCPSSLLVRVIIAVVGIIILAFSLSMYQMADIGSSPADSMPLIIKERLHLPFFVSRVIVDGAFTLVAFLAGGVIGMATLMVFLFLGPIANIFNRHVFAKIVTNESLL